MSGLVLRWTGGGGGDTVCQLLANNNPEAYINFITGISDQTTGRTIMDDDHDPNYPLVSELGRAKPISDRQKLRDDFLKLMAEHQRFIVKFHNFDHEFDTMLKEHLDIIDLGFDLNFLPFIIQANIEKFSKTQHPMYDLKYRYNSNLDKILEKIGQKLNDYQKKQVLIWSMISHAIKCMKEFRLDKSPLKTQDLFYNNMFVESYFKEKNYKIDLNVPFFASWQNNNKKYLPSVHYQKYLENADYNYDNEKQLSLVERYIFLSLAGQNFTFLD